MKLLENNYVWFARIIWAIIYVGLLAGINIDNVYINNCIVVTIFTAIGVYIVSKILTLISIMLVARLLYLNVDIELKYSFTINDKIVL